MADILLDFNIKSSPDKVFEGISTAEGLNAWWTLSSAADPREGGIYELDFGPGYLWRATVTRYDPGNAFELQMTEAMPEWVGSRVGFTLNPSGSGTHVSFYHAGWPQTSDNYRFSAYCWAMYLRILKRHLEHGETVPYEKRRSV